MGGETKRKLSKFLQCADGRSLVARELKVVYLTRATSRYQKWKDHAPRGRVFSFSGSFSFKGHLVVSCPKGNLWLRFELREITLF